ncbi:MAG: hypothetical protein R6U99_08395 [Nioella sp.]
MKLPSAAKTRTWPGDHVILFVTDRRKVKQVQRLFQPTALFF